EKDHSMRWRHSGLSSSAPHVLEYVVENRLEFAFRSGLLHRPHTCLQVNCVRPQALFLSCSNLRDFASNSADHAAVGFRPADSLDTPLTSPAVGEERQRPNSNRGVAGHDKPDRDAPPDTPLRGWRRSADCGRARQPSAGPQQAADGWVCRPKPTRFQASTLPPSVHRRRPRCRFAPLGACASSLRSYDLAATRQAHPRNVGFSPIALIRTFLRQWPDWFWQQRQGLLDHLIEVRELGDGRLCLLDPSPATARKRLAYLRDVNWSSHLTP